MTHPSAKTRAWAQQLWAAEAESQSQLESKTPDAVWISERLRIALTQLIGSDGFTALLRRAVALARTDVPSLRSVKIGGDGRLECLPEFAGPPESVEAAIAITACLLHLLVIFIGERLTLRLVRDAWPDVLLD